MISRKLGLFLPLLLLMVGLFLNSPVVAQSTATVQGTVTDSKGAVLPNVTVTIRNRSTSFERTTQSDSQGNYQFAALPVGTYSIEARVD